MNYETNSDSFAPKKCELGIFSGIINQSLTSGQLQIHDLKSLILRVSFLAIDRVGKQNDGTWKAIKSSISPNKHVAVEPFDWRFFR